MSTTDSSSTTTSAIPSLLSLPVSLQIHLIHHLSSADDTITRNTHNTIASCFNAVATFLEGLAPSAEESQDVESLKDLVKQLPKQLSLLGILDKWLREGVVIFRTDPSPCENKTQSQPAAASTSPEHPDKNSTSSSTDSASCQHINPPSPNTMSLAESLQLLDNLSHDHKYSNAASIYIDVTDHGSLLLDSLEKLMNDSDAMESMSRTFSSILTTHRQIQRAKDELESVNDYFGDDYSPAFIEKAVHSRIDLLHRYNEIKDLGSFLIGKVAEVEGKTVKEMYEELGLDLED